MSGTIDSVIEELRMHNVYNKHVVYARHARMLSRQK